MFCPATRCTARIEQLPLAHERAGDDQRDQDLEETAAEHGHESPEWRKYDVPRFVEHEVRQIQERDRPTPCERHLSEAPRQPDEHHQHDRPRPPDDGAHRLLRRLCRRLYANGRHDSNRPHVVRRRCRDTPLVLSNTIFAIGAVCRADSDRRAALTDRAGHCGLRRIDVQTPIVQGEWRIVFGRQFGDAIDERLLERGVGQAIEMRVIDHGRHELAIVGFGRERGRRRFDAGIDVGKPGVSEPQRGFGG